MKTIKSFVDFINEKYDDNTELPFESRETFAANIKMQEESGIEEDQLDILKTNWNDISKKLKGTIDSVTYAMSEGDDYRFVVALFYGMQHRIEIKDPNIKKIGSIDGESAFGCDSESGEVYNIKDVNINVAVWEEGDDSSTFQHVACLTKDAKKLEKWVNDNMTEADFENDY